MERVSDLLEKLSKRKYVHICKDTINYWLLETLGGEVEDWRVTYGGEQGKLISFSNNAIQIMIGEGGRVLGLNSAAEVSWEKITG